MAVFVITDGRNKYIRRDITGKYVPIGNRVLADEFDARHKAQRVLDYNLSVKLRKKYHVKEDLSNKSKKDLPQSKSSDEVRQDIENLKTNIDACRNDGRLDEFTKKIESLHSFILDAEKRKQELSEELSKIDKELNDVNHYIEINDFPDTKDKCAAIDMLQNMMRMRRKIKNELRVLRQLGECKVDSAMVNDILVAINELDNRKYVPRVLTQLFN